MAGGNQDMTAATTHPAPDRNRRARSAAQSLNLRAMVGLVVLSRLIVWVAAATGGEWGHRVSGWRQVDPTAITQSLGPVGNLLTAPVLRWDGLGYLSIARHGYSATTSIFYPLYPAATAGLGWLLRSDVAAGALISVASFAAGLWLLHRLTELELGRAPADTAVLLLAFAPVSLFFSAMYTESLFLALSVGSIYAARRDRLVLAGALAALATVTRVTGILLVIPIAMWELRRHRRLTAALLWLLLAPTALGAFLAYMQLRGYGWLAPFRNQHAHHFGGPLATVVAAVAAAGHGVSATLAGQRPISPALGGPLAPGFDSIVLLAVLVLATAALVLTFRRLPIEYGVFALLGLLVSIASQTRVQPLEGLDRYTLTIFPLWMATGAWLSERRGLRAVLGLGAVLLAFYSFEFATWAFIA
jgi:hypothetical protein